MQRSVLKFKAPSIKEAMDNLPFGIAFAKDSGIVVLSNHAMNRLCHAMHVGPLQNANLFWETAEKTGTRTNDGAYIIRLFGGEIWLLMRRKCEIRGGWIYELSAQDVTERMRLIDRIDEDNERLAMVGERLRKHSKNALELARKSELLERKQHTHAELGKLLSATRHYLDGGDVDGDALWHRWHINAALMLEETRAPYDADLTASLKKTAEAVGVKLDIVGDELRTKEALEVMIAAGGECLTNLLRHTKGNELYIDIKRESEADVIVITDNAKAPDNEIVEGGGLSSLRHRIETLGGSMQVISNPQYKLVLRVPVG